MKKTVTFGMLAATALTLAACSGNSAPEPEATEAAPAADAAPVDDAAALQAATDGAEGTDPNNNPVPPADGEAAPADGEAAPAAE
jgi:PBP1b-binding outer membrane lipoprotein LpoB